MIIGGLLILLAIIADANIFTSKHQKPSDCGDNSLVSYNEIGSPKRFPWSVLLMLVN